MTRAANDARESRGSQGSTLERGPTAPFARDGSREPPLAARVRILGAPAKPSSFCLTHGLCRIGAGQGVEVLVEDDTVSRLHVELELVPEGVAVRDLSSRNGTFSHGQRIERAVVSLGTRIFLGRVEVALDADLAPESLPLSEASSYGRLHGNSTAMRRLFSLLSRLEGSLVNVLVSGETGVGKELVARAIHEHSAVARGPFVSINCGALERSLAKSELFGHARGAFTGAVESRAGAFELANSGTLFLDEIGELPGEVQPLLLRALEQGVVVRVGENQERSVKARLIAATHRDLRELVRQERFREDLFYRLMVVQVTVPPLRERVEDIPLLVEQFAAESGAAPFPAVVLDQLRSGRYPGNVRELRNAVHAYAAVGALPDTALRDRLDLVTNLQRCIDFDRPYVAQKEELLATFFELYLKALLARTGGNQSEAARISGLERSYVNRVIRRRESGP